MVGHQFVFNAREYLFSVDAEKSEQLNWMYVHKQFLLIHSDAHLSVHV